jgi:beta-galactosidase
MRRRDFVIGLPASVLVTAVHGRAQRGSPLLPTPSVVNPVFRSPVRPWLSLDGKWDFSLDADNEGLRDRWFSPEYWQRQNTVLREINVPGAWEAEGIGKPGLSHSTAREFARIPLRHEYVGIGWYHKALTLPNGWHHRRVWLKIGGVNSKGWFWFNGVYLGSLHNYASGAYKFEITPFIQGGENVLVVRVDNQINSRKGGTQWRDQFGGLYRGVELDSTSESYIDDVWAKPEFENQRVDIRVTVAAPWKTPVQDNLRIMVQVYTLPEGFRAGQGEAEVHSLTYTGSGTPGSPSRFERWASEGVFRNQLTYTGQETVVPVALRPFRPWSPEDPFLYKADVRLERNGGAIDGWVERFGVRKIERRGTNFYLNGRKYFFRGFGDDGIYPLTVSSPADRAYHKRHLELARSYGFNYIRHHTHAETPEYLQAADEVGIMIQAALPYEGIRPSPPGPYQPLDDLNELVRHYRRYISLTTYCMGNEGLHKEGFRRTLYRAAKLLDPTRLVLHQDGGVDYEGISDFRSGPVNTPITESDVKGSMPVVLHEYLNLSGPPDPRLEPLFTGAEAPPYDLAQAKEKVEKLGLEWALVERAIDGGHELQSIYQKLGLENARSVPGVSGYDYWTIVDVLVLMPQGLLDLFWRPKRSSAEYFSHFNREIALLLPDLSPYGLDRVFTSGDAVSHVLSCSNFSEDAISGARVSWTLGSQGKNFSQGRLEDVHISQGAIVQIGRIEFSMPAVDRPLELRLEVKMEGRNVSNEWKFYCFPRSWSRAKLRAAWTTDAVFSELHRSYPSLRLVKGNFVRRSHRTDELLITTKLDENAFRMLESGGKVLLLGLASFPAQKVGPALGWWSPSSNQRGTALADSEAFGMFPVEGGRPNFALFRLFHEAVEMDEKLANHAEPLVLTLGSGPYVIPPEKRPPWAGQVDVGASQASDYLLNVFQTRVGTGRLLASGFDLPSGKPEADYLLDSFLKYVESSSFQPQRMISTTELRRIVTAG